LAPVLIAFLYFLARDIRARSSAGKRPALCLYHVIAIVLGQLTVIYAEVLEQIHSRGFSNNRIADTTCFKEMVSDKLAPSCYIPLYLGIVITLILLSYGTILSVYTGKTRSLGRTAGVYLAAMVIISPLSLISVGVTLLIVIFVGLFGDFLYRKLPRNNSRAAG